MKRNAFFVVLAAATLMLAACGGNTPSSSSVPSSNTSSADSSSETSSSSKEVTEVKILSGWQDNGDSVYDPVVGASGMVMSFDKSGSTWAAAKKSLAAVQDDLASMTKLRFDMGATEYNGNGPMAMILKIEYTDAETNPAKEVKFQFTEEGVHYEWDLSDQNLGDALQMLMFVDPGCGITSGDLGFTVFEFEKGAISAEALELPLVVDYGKNTYATGDTFSVLTKWHDNGDYAYRVVENETTTVVDYLKWGNEWSSAVTVANNVSSFNYLNVKATGPADKTALFKVEGGAAAKESSVAFAGSATTVELTIDLREAGIAEATDVRVLLFAEPASTASSSGTIILSLAEFSNEPLVKEKISNTFIGLNPWETSWNAEHFYDGGDAKFKADADIVNKFSWSNVSAGWSNISGALTGDIGFFGGVKFDLTVSAATTMLVKVQGYDGVAAETDIVFTAETLTNNVTIDLSAKTCADVRKINTILIFPICKDDSFLTTGELTINSVSFVNPRIYAADGSVNAAEIMYGNQAFLFDHSEVEYANVSWLGKGEYESMGFRLDPAADYSGLGKISITIASADCAGVLIKINDAQEYKIETLGTDTLPKTYSFDLTTPLNNAEKQFVILMPGFGSTQAGAIAVSSFSFVA